MCVPHPCVCPIHGQCHPGGHPHVPRQPGTCLRPDPKGWGHWGRPPGTAWGVGGVTYHPEGTS